MVFNPIMKKPLVTERLRIREFTEADAGFIFHLLNTPAWLEFIGNRNIKTLEDARLYIINAPLFSYLKFGFGPYLVELKDSAVPIGMCSLIKRDSLEDVDLGFAFLPEHIGKGYAYETCQAVMEYSKTILGIKKLVAITDTHNTSSVKLLEKIGFLSEGKVKLPGEEEELLFFSKLLGE